MTKKQFFYRFMGDSKRSIKNRARVEGSICASYIHRETTFFVPTISKVICCHCEVVEMKWELKPTNHHCPSSTNQLVLLASHQFIG